MGLKLNLACGRDVREGYVNVDFRSAPGITSVDLSKLPWPFPAGSASEILLYDALEHFSWRTTGAILDECWRVLENDGVLKIQVPHLAQLLEIITGSPFCQRCERETEFRNGACSVCHYDQLGNKLEAIHRVYGGQDYPGNTHMMGFIPEILGAILKKHGFDRIEEVNREKHRKNAAFELVARKNTNLWAE
ncbi:MAG: class I SAM-dependent methyltransferase [Acidiferrobacterales bacterium]